MLKEKLNDVNTRMEKVVHDADTEIAVLQNKLSSKSRHSASTPWPADSSLAAMQLNQEDLQKKTNELADALREKTRKYTQMQELYNKLKRRTLYSQVQTAASDAVDQTLRSNSSSRYPLDDTTGDVPGRDNLQHSAASRPLQGDSHFLGQHPPMPGIQGHGGTSAINNVSASNMIRSFARPESGRGGGIQQASCTPQFPYQHHAFSDFDTFRSRLDDGSRPAQRATVRFSSSRQH